MIDKEDLRKALEKQVEKFSHPEATTYNACALCYIDDKGWCTICPFPGGGAIRCVERALIDGKADEDFDYQLPSDRAAKWKAWYQAWLDDPDLKPPPIKMKEEKP